MNIEFDVYVIIDENGAEYEHFFDMENAAEAFNHYVYQSYKHKYRLVKRKVKYID